MMDDLVTWLRAQWDDDERVARAAKPGPWTAVPVVYGRPEDGWGEPVEYDVVSPSGAVVEHYMHEGGGAVRVDSEHIARWDPARVLKRIAVDRRIVTMIADRKTWRLTPPPTFIDLDIESRVLELLALPYADRPGYREGWRP